MSRFRRLISVTKFSHMLASGFLSLLSRNLVLCEVSVRALSPSASMDDISASQVVGFLSFRATCIATVSLRCAEPRTPPAVRRPPCGGVARRLPPSMRRSQSASPRAAKRQAIPLEMVEVERRVRLVGRQAIGVSCPRSSSIA